MDEQEVQRKRRDNEERATRERAKILGLPYLDTREFEQVVPLINKSDTIPISQMHSDFIIPLEQGNSEEPYRFMITSQTPNSLLSKMRKEYSEDGLHVNFFLISNSAYQTFMLQIGRAHV